MMVVDMSLSLENIPITVTHYWILGQVKYMLGVKKEIYGMKYG
jgi:hypothetical protein